MNNGPEGKVVPAANVDTAPYPKAEAPRAVKVDLPAVNIPREDFGDEQWGSCIWWMGVGSMVVTTVPGAEKVVAP